MTCCVSFGWWPVHDSTASTVWQHTPQQWGCNILTSWEEAAPVVANVKHQASHPLLVQVLKCLLRCCCGVAVECCQPDIPQLLTSRGTCSRRSCMQ